MPPQNDDSQATGAYLPLFQHARLQTLLAAKARNPTVLRLGLCGAHS